MNPNSDAVVATPGGLHLSNGHFATLLLCLFLLSLAGAPILFSETVNPDPPSGSSSTNTLYGDGAGSQITTGTYDSAFGYNAMYKNTTAFVCTAVGAEALYSNTTGFGNTATGVDALFGNTTGQNNTAVGLDALSGNTSGNNNTAVGEGALQFNDTGLYNTAVGSVALSSNTTGTGNTAVGLTALSNNSTGGNNAAMGFGALNGNITGANNTATGAGALGVNNTGNSNTAVGFNAMLNNTTGTNNVALGNTAGSLLTTGSNNIDIGNQGKAGDINMIRIGTKGVQTKALVAGIRGTTAPGGIAVYVDTNGRLGTSTSSERFKTEVHPLGNTSEEIFSINPVTFRYKSDIDPEGIPQFGLIAEEVAKVDPDLVSRDDEGQPYSVRYEAVNAMLLNEFLKEHRKVEAMEAERRLAEARQRKLEEKAEQQETELHRLKLSVEALARDGSPSFR